MATNSRNRIIYQSKALFIAPNATGVQMAITGASTIDEVKYPSKIFAGEDTFDFIKEGTGLMYKLDRVQNVNFGFTINAQDINEMGRLARLTRISNEPPTVNLDYSYYITDGLNERLMGFNFGGIDGSVDPTKPYNDTTRAYIGGPAYDLAMVSGAGALSGFLSENQGQNYYIVTTSEGQDVVGATISSTDNVISFGNGFVTNYELNATVGELPTANVTVEAFNIKSTTSGNSTLGLSGISPGIRTDVEPAVAYSPVDSGRYYNISSGLLGTELGNGEPSVGALRPGDIVITTDAQNPTDDEFVTLDSNGNKNTAHIQSFSFSLPLARTTLNRLGSFFGYNRVIDVPLNMEVSISAFATEFRNNKDLFDTLCGDQTTRDFTVTLKNCADAGSTPTSAIAYQFKGAILTSENHSVDIGGNETVDLTYSIQIGGANDTLNGVFMSGSYTTGNNLLNHAYPRALDQGGDINAFSALVSGFYIPGTGRNY